MKRVLYASLCVVMLVAPAWAHKPYFHNGKAGTPETAVPIHDIDLSQVIYAELTEDAPQVWLRCDAKQGQEIKLELGMPFLESHKDLRPAVAVIGPGLPAASLPFAIPEGSGALIFDSANVADPEFFHEKFTNTDSWVLGYHDVTVPQDGTYYVVGYFPGGELGKLWVAIGTRDEFGLADLFTFNDIVNKVQAFHETSSSVAIPCFVPFLGIGILGFVFMRFARSRRMMLQ